MRVGPVAAEEAVEAAAGLAKVAQKRGKRAGRAGKIRSISRDLAGATHRAERSAAAGIDAAP
jgi:hypothetical protein